MIAFGIVSVYYLSHMKQ